MDANLNVGEGEGNVCSRMDCCRLNGGGGGGGWGWGEVDWRLLTYFRLRRLWCERILFGSSSSLVSLELSWLIAATWARSSLDDEWVLDCARTSFDGWWWRWWRREADVRSVNCVLLRYFCCARTEDDAAKEISVELSIPLLTDNGGDRRRIWPSLVSSCL